MTNKIEVVKDSTMFLDEFLEDLYHAQEPLGDEFAKVLYDNLWDLYES